MNTSLKNLIISSRSFEKTFDYLKDNNLNPRNAKSILKVMRTLPQNEFSEIDKFFKNTYKDFHDKGLPVLLECDIEQDELTKIDKKFLKVLDKPFELKSYDEELKEQEEIEKRDFGYLYDDEEE